MSASVQHIRLVWRRKQVKIFCFVGSKTTADRKHILVSVQTDGDSSVSFRQFISILSVSATRLSLSVFSP